MKRRIFFALIIVMSIISCCALLSACNGGDVKELVLENCRTQFTVGDNFETGDGFAAYAVYGNGDKKDVTSEITIQQEKGFDMSVAGDYMITVSYGGKKAVYKIFVAGFNDVLKKITLDATNAKKVYQWGEKISFDGLKVTATYKNGQDNDYDKTVESDYFAHSIVTESGTESGDELKEFGVFTVTFFEGEINASYEVEVTNADISTVAKALDLAEYGKRFVNGGNSALFGKVDGVGSTTNYVSIFGDNYTCVKESYGGKTTENHYSISSADGSVQSTAVENGKVISSSPVQKDVMGGIPYFIFYYNERCYGIEQVLKVMYSYKEVDCREYKEEADPDKRTYSFSFNCLVDGATPYYYVNGATFTLDENYAVVSARVTQDLYIDSFKIVDGQVIINKINLTDYAAPRWVVNIDDTQTVGERTAKNPYREQSDSFDSFDITLNDKVLADGDVITGNAKDTLYLKIANVIPASASFESDLMYFSDGTQNVVSHTLLFSTGYNAYRERVNSTVITLNLKCGGEWDFIVTTKTVTKRFKIKITGEAPTSLTTEVFNNDFNNFTKVSERTAIVGNTVYFRAVPNQYANDNYTVALIEGESGNLEKTTKGNLPCWSFTSAVAGVYKIKMTSAVASKVSCVLTITFIERPDYSEMLKGSYSTSDAAGGTYTVNFTSTSSDTEVSGSVTVTYKDSGNTVKTETFDFTAVQGEMQITLNHVSGDELGVDFLLSETGALVLEDRYSAKLVLTRTEA